MKKSVVLESGIVLALACSLVACASKDGEGSEKDPSVEGTPECDPNGAIPCYEGLAEPCENFDTQFDGDEYCLAPPDPSIGQQAHVGPLDYDDPAQTDKYMIQPGDETNWSEVVVSKNDTTVYTRGYHSHMRPGSHHFIMFGMSDTSMAGQGPTMNGSGLESAAGGIGGQFLGGATKAVQNIDTKGEHPEDQGIGHEMAANRAVAFNVHFVNPTDHPLLQELWVNFIYIPEDEVTQYVKPITWYGGLGMAVAPGSDVLLKNAPNSCTTSAERRIAMMTGHVHASTLRITTMMNESTLLFEDYDWHEPTEWRFNRAVANGTPNAASKVSGGYSGILNAVPGDQFTWECEVQNRTTSTLTFSNRVYDGEMCNVFGFYITPDRTSTPWLCAFF